MDWKEFKQIIPEFTTIEIKPTDIMVGVFNFAHGDVNHYKFQAKYVRRDGDRLWNHSVYVYGVVTFESGKNYNAIYELTYTEGEELDKLADAMRKATPRPTNDMWDELRKY